MPNNLFVNRLLIYTEDGKIAFDETFHKGINIIRGNNSSGKSTITHFIFYVLGGDFVDFVPEARACASVYAEVEMNGAVVAIRRDLEKDEHQRIKRQAPMYFFWGTLDEALSNPKEKSWARYGYKTLEHRRSFSNVLFDNLGLPIVKGDNAITFHQILRLLYIDQESPTSSLFYYELFDSQLTRETVADLLLGIYNEQLYESKKRFGEVAKELVVVGSEVKATRQFFSDPLTLDPSHVETIIDNREAAINGINEQIATIRNSDNSVEYTKKTKLEFELLNEESIKQRHKVNDLRNQIEDLQYEIEDSEFFISTLEAKISALKNSIDTRQFLGSLPLNYCPECLSSIKKNENPKVCKLCKEDTDDSFGIVQARRMEQEIRLQIDESRKILSINASDLTSYKASYQAELVKLQQLQRQVNSALVAVRSINQEVLDRLLQEKGFVEGEILQYRTLLENAIKYRQLLDRQRDLKEESTRLEAYISKAEAQQLNLKKTINQKIREEGVFLLNNDLDRQDEFKLADEFFIDFPNNIAFLSNRYSRYSASSNFYLKISARFALFLASLSIERMRYPRFIFADNMEDKGIEKERAQNFQRILIKRLETYSPDSYQMIYTTSYITEELNNSPFVVGEYYTKENPTLKNV